MRPEPADRRPRATPPTSHLAIAGLAVGTVGVLLPCCPVAPIAAVVLGVLARIGIRRAGGAVGGGRLAIVAILLGAGGMLGQVLLLQWVSGAVESALRDRVTGLAERLIEAAADGDRDAVAQAWGAWADPQWVDETMALAAEAVGRCGPFRGVSLVDLRLEGAAGEAGGVAAVIWRFEGRSLPGSVEFRLGAIVPQEGWIPSVSPRRIVVSDSREGDLEAGRSPASTGP